MKGKGCLRTVLFLVVVYNVLRFLISFWTSGDLPEEMTWLEPACEERLLEDLQTLDRQHQREWQAPGLSQSYCMQYATTNEESTASAMMRTDLRARYDEGNFWGSIYAQLVTQSADKLDYLADSLKRVADRENYDAFDLARVTVAFVQDIPYSYVIPVDCSEYNIGNSPCMGQVPYGIISPYEFAHTLYGDCDTRAVLLYVLLRKLGFDPMIVVSNEYAHAMLAINLPAQGEFLTHAGKRYYFWETTATGWGVGMLPPDTNNKNYWKIALVHES